MSCETASNGPASLEKVLCSLTGFEFHAVRTPTVSVNFLVARNVSITYRSRFTAAMRSLGLLGNACCVEPAAPYVNSGKLNAVSNGITFTACVNELMSTRRMFSPNFRVCFPRLHDKLSFSCQIVVAAPDGVD